MSYFKVGHSYGCVEGMSLSDEVLLTEDKSYKCLDVLEFRIVVTDDRGKECHADKRRFDKMSDEDFDETLEDLRGREED